MQTFQLTNGDIQFSSATGRPLTISGTPKFKQDVAIVLDVLANLDGMIGMVGDTFSIRSELSKRLSDAFALYASQQATIQRNDRPVNETYSKTTEITVYPAVNPATGVVDNTTFGYRISVLSVAGATPTTITGTLTQ